MVRARLMVRASGYRYRLVASTRLVIRDRDRASARDRL